MLSILILFCIFIDYFVEDTVIVFEKFATKLEISLDLQNLQEVD